MPRPRVYRMAILLAGVIVVLASGAAIARTSIHTRLLGSGSGPAATGQPASGVPGAGEVSSGSPGAGPSASETPNRLPGATVPGSTPPVVTSGSRTRGEVALTFDADMTDAMIVKLATGQERSYANLAVLDLLERQRVPATFFLTGEWVEQYPQVTRRIAGNERFELANHSYRHSGFVPRCYSLPPLDPAARTADVARTFDVLAPYGGRQSRYFRFPGGCYDDGALRSLAPLGVTVVQWDVVSGDPFATAAAPIVNAVLSQVRPGSIVVLHITEGNARFTDDALPQILAGLRQRNLQPVTLSELLAG